MINQPGRCDEHRKEDMQNQRPDADKLITQRGNTHGPNKLEDNQGQVKLINNQKR